MAFKEKLMVLEKALRNLYGVSKSGACAESIVVSMQSRHSCI